MKPYRIPELARKYVEYDMIQKHTELPKLADARLRLLYAFLIQQQSLAKHSELYTLVISLVQLGMDTHDLIDTDEENHLGTKMRSRQLKVLAGDYLSARFYQLLSEAGQISMVSRISNAVSEVNRLKVNLYVRMRQMKVNAEDYLHASVELRSTLFYIFTDLLEGKWSLVWPNVLAEVSRCEVLLDEIVRSEGPARFNKSWAYWHVMQMGSDEEREHLAQRANDPELIESLVNKYKVRIQLTEKLEISAAAVKAAAVELGSDHLISECSHIINDLMSKRNGITPALNETR